MRHISLNLRQHQPTNAPLKWLVCPVTSSIKDPRSQPGALCPQSQCVDCSSDCSDPVSMTQLKSECIWRGKPLRVSAEARVSMRDISRLLFLERKFMAGGAIGCDAACRHRGRTERVGSIPARVCFGGVLIAWTPQCSNPRTAGQLGYLGTLHSNTPMIPGCLDSKSANHPNMRVCPRTHRRQILRLHGCCCQLHPLHRPRCL